MVTKSPRLAAAARPLFLLAILCLFPAGCAVKTHEEWAKAADLARNRTGERPVWVQSPEDARLVQAKTAEILAAGIDEDAAVRLALMNNPELQAAFEDIGIVKADLIQAGMPKNPLVSALFTFPAYAGTGNWMFIALDAALSLVDLAKIPLREAPVRAELERTLLAVANEALKTSTAVRTASVERAGKAQILVAAKEYAAKTTKLLDASKKHRQFGLIRDDELMLLEATVASAKLDAAAAESALTIATARLSRAVGVEIAGARILPPKIDARTLPSRETAVAQAVQDNLDVQAALWKVQALKAGLDLEKWRLIDEFDVFGGYSREETPIGKWSVGAAARIPLFDQNQAGIAKADHLIRQAEKKVRAEEDKARENAVRALEDADMALRRVRDLENVGLPAAKRAAAFLDKYVAAMQETQLAGLEAGRAVVREQKALAEAVEARDKAFIALDEALGGKTPTP